MSISVLRTLAPVGAFAGALVGGDALAAPCATGAALTGDPTLVSQVSELLDPHGLGRGEVIDHCDVVRVDLQRRDGAIAVVRTSDPQEERIVTELATAAIVIESWTRDDFEHPLLERRAVDSSPTVVRGAAQIHAVEPALDRYEPRPGLQMFAAAETSFADDGTSWGGALFGVCVQVGRVCASARGRVAMVVDGPGIWERADRHTTDILVGTDVPFRVRGTVLSFGIGVGIGMVYSDALASGMALGSETSGLRGDAHLAWNVHLGKRISLDLSVAVDLAQVGDVEGSLSPAVTKEPYVFGRLGAGLRFGGD